MTKRRKRSEMTEGEAVSAVKTFARYFQRFGETSERGMFVDVEGKPAWVENRSGNVQFMVPEAFSDQADNFFEAMRVLGGHKLPAKRKNADA